jgi:N6-L-threonylcarbamoyladenine synthase
MIVLGIESSCDDTGAAVVKDGKELSNIVASQDDVHAPFGGIVPELAARNHVLHILPVIEKALRDADLTLDDIDGIAATRGPGLVGSLLVGLCAAKAIARARDLPFVGVNHIEGHLLSGELDAAVPRPFLGLVVSGGHSALYLAREDRTFGLLGQTRDDAAGEAFDKAAKLLGLGYPGGREIQRVAETGNPQAMRLPRPRVRGAELDMSFSGLKTALWQELEKHPELDVPDVAASFQEAVVDTLAKTTRRALQRVDVKALVVTGGVSANTPLRERMAEVARDEGVELHVPALSRCTDNAAMIAYAGWQKLVRGERDALDLNAVATLPIGPRVEIPVS